MGAMPMFINEIRNGSVVHHLSCIHIQVVLLALAVHAHSVAWKTCSSIPEEAVPNVDARISHAHNLVLTL